MIKAADILLSFFFPARCPYCNKTIEYNKTACDKCKAQFPETYSQNYAKGGYPCCSPFFYRGIFRKGVRRFKFGDKPESSKKLAYPLAQCVKKAYDIKDIDIITYVPMYPEKELDRGFNQSKLLARDLSKILNIRFETLLEKVKDNNPQHDCLTETQRRDNVKGVYKAVNSENLKGKTVLIIDDVLTTGYTLGECCKQVEKKTKTRVICATLCAKNNIYT